MALSLLARQARLGALRAAIDASGGGAVHVHAAPMAVSPETAPDSPPLAIVSLALPCAVVGATSNLATLALTPVVGNAAAAGLAAWVRFVDGAGVAVFDCAAGLPGSGAEAIVTDNKPSPSLQLFTGGEVQIAAGRWAE